jgi:hypothetical protein
MMKMKQLRFALAVAAIGAFTAISASASVLTFVLNQDGCTGTCGIAPFGTVTITDNGTGALAFVTVTETVGANERFAGSGAGDALEFNVVGPISISNITPNFVIGPAPDTASAFGTFLRSITCSTCNGGQAGNPVGPLSFDVSSATGVTTADFIANSKGFFFAADIVGADGNTGNVAAQGGTLSETPEPVTMFLMGVGLLGVGLFGKFRRA